MSIEPTLDREAKIKVYREIEDFRARLFHDYVQALPEEQQLEGALLVLSQFWFQFLTILETLYFGDKDKVIEHITIATANYCTKAKEK